MTVVALDNDKSSIIESYKARHQEAVKKSTELLAKLQTLSHSQMMIIRVQMCLRYLSGSYNEVLHLQHSPVIVSFDHFLAKYVNALELLEKTVQDILNQIRSNQQKFYSK